MALPGLARTLVASGTLPQEAAEALYAKAQANKSSFITEAHPELAPLMHRRCAVLDWPARRLELLPEKSSCLPLRSSCRRMRTPWPPTAHKHG